MARNNEEIDEETRQLRKSAGRMVAAVKAKDNKAFEEFVKMCQEKGVNPTDELIHLAKSTVQKSVGLDPLTVKSAPQQHIDDVQQTNIVAELTAKFRDEMIAHSTDVQQLNQIVIQKDNQIAELYSELAERDRIISYMGSLMSPQQLQKLSTYESTRAFVASGGSSQPPAQSVPQSVPQSQPRAPDTFEIPYGPDGKPDWRKFNEEHGY